MNRHLHRVVFNAARGMRMVVQETAASTGKGASKATTAAGAMAIAGVMMAASAHAQIVGAPNVPGNLRPTVLVAPNGVPLVNIQTPSAAGVSRNVYNQFNVGANGAILNNSRVNVQTQLGGFVQGNPYLATGPARIILNEINGGSPSQLRGYIEVGGQRAEVIIANPAGISVDGGGFINASRATLTTGTPQFNAIGGLDSFLVRGGTVTIDGAGLDASKTDYAAILARAVQVNAGIWASELKVVTGANEISADHSQVTPTAGTGAAPTFALDVAALGGMYANKISLIGTEAGLGVRNAGSIGASAGNLVVTASGRLENTGTLEGQSVQLASTGSDIVNQGTIRQTSMASLALAAPTISNTNDGWIGSEPVPASTAGTGSGSTGAGATPSSGSSGSTGTTASTGSTTTAGTSTPAAAPIEPGSLTAAGAIRNDGGKVYAGGPITVQTANLVNNGGALSVTSMSLNQPSFQNTGGTLNISGAFTANLGTFNNSTGTLHAGSLDITTTGDLNNQDGMLTSDSNANLTVGGNADNTRGTISATGALTANVAGAIQNTSGTLTSNQNLTVAGQSLNNSQGTISSASGNVQFSVGQQLLNTDGHIASGGTLAIQTGSLDGSKGSLQSTGDMSVTATQALTSTGTNVAGGNATLKGASVDLSGSQTGASDITITATQGNVTTSGATVATPGTLAITANAQPGQTLLNSAGQLNAARLKIDASNIANTNGGEIVQTGTGATILAVSGSIDNSNSHIATNGQDLTLQAASITNTNGKIDHAGTGTLTIAGGSFNGANGKITGNGALAVNLTGMFNQDGGTAYAQQINLLAGSLSNQNSGSIVQAGTGTTTLNVGGALVNNGGTVASNGVITANAGSMANQGGKFQAAGSSDLNLTVTGLLDNSAAGQILAGSNATIQAGSLKNDAGNLTAVGNLNATVSGAATNVGGTLAANGNTTVTAASLDNSAGTAAAVNGNLAVTTTGTTTNTGGTLQAGGTTTLNNGGLSSAGGKVFGNSLSIDTHGNALDNSAKGTIAATTTVDVKSGALNNDAGLVQSGGTMVIDTNGQALTNANASGYTNGQGGITSADMLTLSAGAVNSSAGFIGAKGAFTANTQGFSNTAGGKIIGQAAVTINTNGVTYDNSGGQTQAVGALTVNAGNIQNVGGLFRSSDTTTLSAATVNNANTSGTDQGIEGTNVAISATNLGNQTGAVRAAQTLTVTGGGTIDNSAGGLLSAGDTLKLVDPNAANPSAKTLNVVNTGGTLTASNSLQIDAAKFSNDGSFTSGRDMAIALTQDIVNNRDVSVSGNLTYGTTGHLTNNAKLLAGQTLTVNGNVVDNTATGEMSGTNTIVNAGTLNNRGLIDSHGDTNVNARTLNNIGTGRLYGDAISISAGTVVNDTETVGGVTTAATIASRGDLDIGATNIINREHALIFSGGNMAVGGALDANRAATGQGGTLDNLSADIQSLGNMSISMAQANNRDMHIQLGTPTSISSVMVGVAPVTPVGSGVGRTTQYTLAEVTLDPANGFVYRKDTGELVGMGGYGLWTNNITTVTDTAINADPAHLIAGGNMTVNGRLYNQDSQVLAGGTITASDYQSSQLTGSVNVSGLASVINNQGQVQGTNIPIVLAPVSIPLGAYKYQPNLNATTGYNAGTAATGAGSATGGGAGGAAGGTGAGVIVEVAANVGTVVGAGGAGAGASGGASAGNTQTIPTVVRTSTPNLNVPQASLFRTQAGGNYLIETDPRFANYRNWLSSDYLLSNLGLDPNNILKRLGDGFYEQKLIREQVAQLTGYRYLDGFNNDEDQYAALMNAGVTFAKQYGLRPGVALTAAQMAQLTSDIVWLVEQTVTLPDGSTQKVLVPQVYVRVLPGDIDGSGALLSADATVIKSTGDVTNKGTIAGRSLVSITAENVNNLDGGRIAGGSVGIDARNNINNIGASITAKDAAVLKAGGDINIETTTRSRATTTAIDRVAGVYVTNPGGTLIASAGHDVNLIGAAMVSVGSVAVGAGHDVNLGTVTEGYTISFANKNIAGISSQSKEIGSVIQGQNDVSLAASNNVNIRAGTVISVDGAVTATAKNDINITAGQATSSVAAASQKSSNGLFRKSSSSTLDSSSTVDVLSSSLSGKTVTLVAGNDINAQATQLSSQDAMSLWAGRDINLTTANRTTQDLHASQQRSSSTGLSKAWAVASDAGGPVGGYGNRQFSGNSASADIRTQAVGTTISAGSLQTISGRDTTLQAATIVADKDIIMTAGRNLTIESAQNTELSSSSSANGKSGFIGSWSSPGLGNIKDFGAQATISTTQQSSQVASLTGNVTLVAGNEYRQTASSVLAAGQAGPQVGGDINILAKNVTINEAYNTEQTVSMQRSSSSKLGGSASFMGVSTDSLRNARSTVRAMEDTSGNGRMQALGALNLAMAGQQAYGAGSTLAGALSGSGPSLTDLSNAGQLSYGVSVSASRNTSQGTSVTTNTTAVGSSVTGANNVNIVATGAGAGSNIHAVGSTIAAGNTVNLAADNDILLEASKNTSLTVGQNSSHGSSVGVTFGAGAQTGFSIQLGVQNGKGSDNQNETTYNVTQVSGGNAVNVSSGRNLTLNGGTIEGNRVKVDVGGDLNITTLQDVSVGQSRQSSNGFGVSLCIPPICYGAVATASGNTASAKADGVFISPSTQSGIKAGDGGFDVNVKGNTNLTGAVIESTQAAIDAGKNSFSTGGTLTMVDLQNVSQSSGSSYSVGAAASVGQTTDPNANPWQRSEQDRQSQPYVRPTGIGLGSESSSQSSTTKSGISGLAGDQTVRTGDTTSAGTLIKNWNTQDIIRNVQAQAQITQDFWPQATSTWSRYADAQRDAAVKNNDPEGAACWGSDGACRAAGHSVIGGLAGGVGGALGAGVASYVATDVSQAVTNLGLTGAAHDAVVAGLNTAIGGALGGASGAAGAVTEAFNNFLTHTQYDDLKKKLAACNVGGICSTNDLHNIIQEIKGYSDQNIDAVKTSILLGSSANIKNLEDQTTDSGSSISILFQSLGKAYDELPESDKAVLRGVAANQDNVIRTGSIYGGSATDVQQAQAIATWRTKNCQGISQNQCTQALVVAQSKGELAALAVVGGVLAAPLAAEIAVAMGGSIADAAITCAANIPLCINTVGVVAADAITAEATGGAGIGGAAALVAGKAATEAKIASQIIDDAAAAASRGGAATLREGQQLTQLEANAARLTPCCFAPGTLVSTEKGERAIESIKVGERVWTRLEDGTGAPFLAPVTATHVRDDRPILRLSIQEGDKSEDLLVTPGHPFYVPGRGFVGVETLRSGDPLVSRSGQAPLRVRSVALESPKGVTHNLTVEAGHTFFVGAFDTWVHNVGPCVSCANGSCAVHLPDSLPGIGSGGTYGTGVAGPEVNRFISDASANRVAEVFSAVKSNPTLLAQGESFGTRGGSVTAQSLEGLTQFEIQFAYDSAAAGNKVIILGGSKSPGLDFIINGQRYELATVTSNSSSTVVSAALKKLESAATGTVSESGASIIIDGRAANLSIGNVQKAMQEIMNLPIYKSNPQTITVYTAQGQIVFKSPR
ncbi:filamentous hemagglutinin [Variovorax sp. YR266]|uniref:two-partner secretion domain-containing protein n=1 Tax=Variovorax sp. YR266 TaxID=1884386 RepID=UPI00089B1441|nr:hemagglutinin repeat-containing protein [Variovorax sp. YR266]SDZ43171.1 filamentous hemagglutinin [Variovorax sp. YR266]